jgi:hypothetical protein
MLSRLLKILEKATEYTIYLTFTMVVIAVALMLVTILLRAILL